MNKLFAKIAGLTAALAMVAGAGVALASHAEAKGVRAADTTVSMTAFSAISGNVDGDSNVSYEARKGSASTAPAVNSDQIRVYQNGGEFEVTANNGVKLTSVTVGSDMATTVGVVVDAGDESAGQAIAKGDTYTVDSISADSVLFICRGTDKNSRLYVNSLEVTYHTEGEVTQYAVSFNANGGTGEMADVLVNEGAQYPLPDNGFTAPEGKQFKCWSVDSEEKDPGEKITVSAAIEVTAVWEDIPEPPAGATPITLSAEGGTSASAAVVSGTNVEHGDNAIKCGTSKVAGAMVIHVGENATKLNLHAAGWKGESVTLTPSASGVSFDPTSLSLTADDGVSNNSPFALSGDANNFAFSLTLTGVGASGADIALTATSGKRFVVWDATYESGTPEPPTPQTTYSVTFEGNGSSSRPVQSVPAKISDLEDGTVQQLSGSASRWGYTFLGWGATAEATENISSVTIDGADVTVYARWVEDHTVAGAYVDNPFTVAQARAVIDDSSAVKTAVYAAGIICSIDTSWSSQHSNISFSISADGTTSGDKLQAFRCVSSAEHAIAGDDDVPVGATVTLFGNLKKYSSTYEFDAGCTVVEYTAPSTGDIEVTFNPASRIAVGAEGKFVASTEATNPVYTFSSADVDILNVDEDGSYEAIAAGKVNVTVNVTSDEGNGTKTVEVEVTAVKTVSEAVAIAAALTPDNTTIESYFVNGFVSSLDADGKARAVNITDGEKEIMVFFGGGSDAYTSLVAAAKIGSKVAVFGNIQNYKGTYEMKNNEVSSVLAGDADSYSAGAYFALNSVCETGVDAVTEEIWATLEAGFNALSDGEKAKLQADDVSEYGMNVMKWVGRYEIIASHTSLSNFMSRSNVSSGRFVSILPSMMANDGSIVIIAIIAIASISAIAALIVIKKRKHQ